MLAQSAGDRHRAHFQPADMSGAGAAHFCQHRFGANQLYAQLAGLACGLKSSYLRD
jgi:hypothetical protein